MGNSHGLHTASSEVDDITHLYCGTVTLLNYTMCHEPMSMPWQLGSPALGIQHEHVVCTRAAIVSY
jgi:hypothetical protein